MNTTNAENLLKTIRSLQLRFRNDADDIIHTPRFNSYAADSFLHFLYVFVHDIIGRHFVAQSSHLFPLLLQSPLQAKTVSINVWVKDTPETSKHYFPHIHHDLCAHSGWGWGYQNVVDGIITRLGVGLLKGWVWDYYKVGCGIIKRLGWGYYKVGVGLLRRYYRPWHNLCR